MEEKDIYRFPALLAYYESGISITFPDFPGCVSHADNDDESVEAAKEVLLLHLRGMAEDNEPIPKPTPRSAIVCSSIERVIFTEIHISAVTEKTNSAGKRNSDFGNNS